MKASGPSAAPRTHKQGQRPRKGPDSRTSLILAGRDMR
ncbi:rCG44469 [Rattus norvegicus]|uniref:RCG44469 n=1 Tax=Rattus norvegicus TaxID=10116 RepID=A6I5E1_RAT|nr:rCG44469 [Rattus norvegicus]